MYNFEDLKQAKKKAQVENKSEKKDSNFTKCFDQGIDYISKFNDSKFDKQYLTLAAEKFIECTTIKSNNVDVYVYLAYISFVLNDIKLTHKYLAIASDINSESELLKKFKAKLSLYSVSK
ncbi:MAG: hypothetical protein ACK4IX_07235 [Candidatus Sericytochromatia bacterium]